MTQAAATKRKLRYTVMLLTSADEPGYTVMVPALPGCLTQGDTVQEALENAKEAIEVHLDGFAVDGLDLPEEEADSLLASVEVEVEG